VDEISLSSTETAYLKDLGAMIYLDKAEPQLAVGVVTVIRVDSLLGAIRTQVRSLWIPRPCCRTTDCHAARLGDRIVDRDPEPPRDPKWLPEAHLSNLRLFR
jgi:hypothetical protein